MTEPTKRKIHCCGCRADVQAKLTDGREIYPHREDLWDLPFWKCDQCGNYVGCHHKTQNRTRPLGCIPTEEIRHHRNEIHKLLDQIWKDGMISRKEAYRWISARIGKEYHTANIRSVEEAKEICWVITRLAAHSKMLKEA